MATINSSDIIFATVVKCGKTIASVRLSGMTTFNDIVKYLSNMLRNTAGLLTLSLRNGTQGWQQQRSIVFAPKTAEAPVQLSLF